MANKYFALLLVVCLIATASVDAQEMQKQCLQDCLHDQCGENPKLWCDFLCTFACAGGVVLAKTDKMQTNAVMTDAAAGKMQTNATMTDAAAPLSSRKVQTQLVKETKEIKEELH